MFVFYNIIQMCKCIYSWLENFILALNQGFHTGHVHIEADNLKKKIQTTSEINLFSPMFWPIFEQFQVGQKQPGYSAESHTTPALSWFKTLIHFKMD